MQKQEYVNQCLHDLELKEKQIRETKNALKILEIENSSKTQTLKYHWYFSHFKKI